MAGADFLSLLGAAGGPSVVALSAFYLLLRHELRNMKEDVHDLKEDHIRCQVERREVENALHSRCTDNRAAISRIQGRFNGK